MLPPPPPQPLITKIANVARRWNEKKQKNDMCNHFIRSENSRIRGVLLPAELTMAVGGVDNLPGVTVDPRWKEGKHISISVAKVSSFMKGTGPHTILPCRPHAGSVFPITQLKLMTFLKARPNHFGLNQLDFAQTQVRLAKTAEEMNSVIGKHARRAIYGKN